MLHAIVKNQTTKLSTWQGLARNLDSDTGVVVRLGGKFRPLFRIVHFVSTKLIERVVLARFFLIRPFFSFACR